jgi:putative membrane protein
MGTNYKKILSIIEYNELPKTFAIFYSVGLLLFAIPLTRPLFLFILPLSLLFVFAAVLYHHKRWDAKFIYFGISVATLSFLIEMAGVKTGLVFGIYSYKGSLGAELLETPLMIGLNWFMLTYCSAAIMTYVAKRTAGFMGSALKAAGGALLMLAYDFVAELVAPVMNMWEFQDMRPPAENYVMPSHSISLLMPWAYKPGENLPWHCFYCRWYSFWPFTSIIWLPYDRSPA